MKMEEERFRVSVCLQHYYTDRRSRAYISVIPKNKVQWLQQRLRTLFGFEGQFFLRSRGHLLHPDEPLSLLRPDDPVEVVPLPEEVSRVEERVTDNKKLNGIDDSETQGELHICLPSEETSKKLPHEEVPKWEAEGRDNKLLEMKQRALQLLDQFSDENQHYVDEPDGIPLATVLAGGPKRRRRVRRRKHRTSNEGSSNNDDPVLAPMQTQHTEVHIPSGQPENGSISSRKPRLVRSLSPT